MRIAFTHNLQHDHDDESQAEFDRQESVVLGHAPAWIGDLRMAHGALADPLDLPAVVRVLAKLGFRGAGPVDRFYPLRGGDRVLNLHILDIV